MLAPSQGLSTFEHSCSSFVFCFFNHRRYKIGQKEFCIWSQRGENKATNDSGECSDFHIWKGGAHNASWPERCKQDEGQQLLLKSNTIRFNSERSSLLPLSFADYHCTQFHEGYKRTETQSCTQRAQNSLTQQKYNAGHIGSFQCLVATLKK